MNRNDPYHDAIIDAINMVSESHSVQEAIIMLQRKRINLLYKEIVEANKKNV